MQSTSTAKALPPEGELPASSTTLDTPTRSAWLAVLSVAVGSFALVTTEFLPVGLLPSIAAELKVTEGLAGMMVTIPGIVAAFAAILVTIGVGKTDFEMIEIG